MSIDLCYQVLSTVTMVVLVVLALLCLVRCVLGPRISDRDLADGELGPLAGDVAVVYGVGGGGSGGVERRGDVKVMYIIYK